MNIPSTKRFTEGAEGLIASERPLRESTRTQLEGKASPLYSLRSLSNLAELTSFAAILFCSAAPLLASTPNQPGVFNVSDYTASGTQTDYDMARQAADAYDALYPWSVGSVLILKPGINLTCDAVPLPSLGNQSTTSLIGFGSGTSSIVKNVGCVAGAATLSHQDSPNGVLSRGWYQGFTVNANHIDSAACEIYGMSLTTFIDVSCGDAVAGSDHELEFGNRDANSVGWMDNIYIYDLKTFDTVSGGAGAMLTPVWSGNTLSEVNLVSEGTSAYTPQYTRALVFGPDLPTCTTIPTLVPTLSANSHVSGAMITNPGQCTSTTHLYILIQDGTPLTYGMKFSGMADSHAWGLQALGSTTYGEGWLNGSANNSISNEHPSSNELFGLIDNGNGNRHLSPVFKNPAGYAAGIYSQNGTIQHPLLTWGAYSYTAASGYYLGNDRRVYQDWMIQDSSCGSASSVNYLSITTERGVLSDHNPLPSGVTPQNLEACDGSGTTNWAIQQ